MIGHIIVVYLCIYILVYFIWAIIPGVKAVSLTFAWYDVWIGFFYDKPRKILYIFPLPFLGIKVWFDETI